MALKIQYCSDLHLEFDANSKYLERNPLKVSGEILILAGDIVPLHDEFFNNSFFKYISDNYKQVFWVPGNHEFYYKDMSEFSDSYVIDLNKTIKIVHNTELMYERTRFIFSTLWSEIQETNAELIEQNVSDFHQIKKDNRKFKAKDFNQLHQTSLNFIAKTMQSAHKKTVVVTHHVPSALCNSAEHSGSPINEAFSVDLTEFIKQNKPDFWIYGHSHFNCNPLIIGQTMMLTNQLGYVQASEHFGYKNNAYFSV